MCLSAHFAKCSINNPAFYARIEYKNFRTTIKRAEIFADAEKAITPQYKRLKCSCITTFQSTLPVGGATTEPRQRNRFHPYFNPRSPWGERQTSHGSPRKEHHFNPRSPWGGATTWQPGTSGSRRRFQSTLPVGGATITELYGWTGEAFQSTLPVGGATWRSWQGASGRYFNPRSPWGERRHRAVLPSPPASYFNPRSPWGEQPQNAAYNAFCDEFQSTLPVGGATLTAIFEVSTESFQSTLPVGGATSYHHQTGREQHISIHAPRGGSDFPGSTDSPGAKNFNPRSPWGERLHANNEAFLLNIISIHAPRGGSDPQYQAGSAVQQAISIHAPRGGSDKKGEYLNG